MRVNAQSIVGSSLLCLLTVAGVGAADDLRLIEAVRNQDHQAVRALLNQKVDVNVPQSDGATALLWAAHLNDVDTAGILIRAGANVNVTNDFGITPLSLACTNRSAAIVEKLLKAGANANLAIANGVAPIMTCARTGNVDTVRMLLDHGADVNAREPLQNQTALMWAVAERHPDVARLLIERGATVSARTKTGFTALHFAAREGELESARILLAAGLDVNVQSQKDPSLKKEEASGYRSVDRSSDGSTPLLVATMRAQVPFALFLLEQGANPNDDGAGFTALHWAAGAWENPESNPVFGFVDPMSGIPDRQAKLQLVKALLARGANPNARITKNPPGFVGGYRESKVGATPFFLAAYALDVELLRLLLDAGADPGLKTRDDTTPLMAAAGVNRRLGLSPAKEDDGVEVVKFLLDLGNNAAAINGDGENALFGVAYLGWNRLLQLLVDHGAGVNVVSKAGITPWLAAEGLGDRFTGVEYHKDTAALLVKRGADPKLGTPCLAQGKCRAK